MKEEKPKTAKQWNQDVGLYGFSVGPKGARQFHMVEEARQ